MSNASYTIHGGSWNDDAAGARPVFRNAFHPDLRSYDVGFRAVEEHGIYVVRSGAWYRLAARARPVYRNHFRPDGRGSVVGFRIMEEVKE